MTDPELIPYWTSTGKDARALGFRPVAGTRFPFVAKPMPGWRGIVDCEVLDVRERELLRYVQARRRGWLNHGEPAPMARAGLQGSARRP
jgi:uncharacterized protein YndB with AHSA1/START domain